MDQELLAANTKTPRFTLTGAVAAKCVAVYDGDTAQFVFRIAGGPLFRYTGRLIGYNTAEIHGDSEEERSAAHEARNALAALILNQIVKLDITSFDKYGRILVNVNDGAVNAEMITNGWGVAYNGKGEKHWAAKTESDRIESTDAFPTE